MRIFKRQYFISYLVFKHSELDGYGSILYSSRLQGMKLYREVDIVLENKHGKGYSTVFISFTRFD